MADAVRPVGVLRTLGPERLVFFEEKGWVRQSPELDEADAQRRKAGIVSGWDATDFQTTLASMGIQCAGRRGKKPSQNQDGFLVAVGDDGKGRRFTLLLLADGYGDSGRAAAEFVVLNLPRLFLEDPDRETNPAKAIEKSFASCEEMFVAQRWDSGSSCTMAYIVHEAKHRDLYLGHVGNSRAVMFARPEGGKEQRAPTILTVDHTLCTTGERHVNMKHGVPEFDEDWKFCKPITDELGKTKLERGAFSSLTRTFGCRKHKQFGVTATPDVTHVKCDEGRGEILLMCTDGVWRVLPGKEVCVLARHGAESLVQESHLAWEKVCKGYSDDITVLLLPLSQPRAVC